MFLSDKTAKAAANAGAKKAAAPRDHNAVTILTSGCHFSGKLHCRGASRIGGKIEGHIVSEGLLIVEEGAVITAEIKAEEVIIQGRVHGKLQASGRVELTASSEVDGDISTPVLIVREGARFNGLASMTKREERTAQVGRGAPRIVAAADKGVKPEASILPSPPSIEHEPKIDAKIHKAPSSHVPIV